MDDLRFYVLLNCMSVISGRLAFDNEMERRLRLTIFPPLAGLEPRTAKSVGQASHTELPGHII